MSIYALGDLEPDIHPDAFVHPDAVVIGSVTIGAQASIWPTTVLRGDYGRIVIGERTSVQDGTIIHATAQWPTLVGSGCVVGHNTHLEGCDVGEGCLIGSGSIVLNRAVVEPHAGVGAAALVGEGMRIFTGQLALGIPAKQRPAPPDLGHWVTSAVEMYIAMAARYRTDLRRIG